MMRSPGFLVLPLVMSQASCGGDEPGPPAHDGGPTGCAAHERFVEGKGCLAAGVQDDGCPASTLSLDDGTCQPAGVQPESCGAGFEPDGSGGCDPILPTEPCGRGLMAVPGERSCREVAPCAAGAWGDIPVEASTVYVDSSYTGTDSDGTAAKPWKTIQVGVDAAAPDAIVALAAGSYAEDVVIQSKPVRLWGRCPSLVEILGSGAGFSAVEVSVASGAEVRDVAVTGGIALVGSGEMLIDRAWVHDAELEGLYVYVDSPSSEASVAIERSLFEGNRATGIIAFGASATIDGSVVRSTRARASDLWFGRGMSLGGNPSTGTRGSAAVRNTVVELNRETGIAIFGSDVTVEASVVRGTLPEEANGLYGLGMTVEDDANGARSNLTLRSSVVEGNRHKGIGIIGSDAVIESTVVRTTRPQEADQRFGRGISVQERAATGQPSNVMLRSVLLDGNSEMGLAVQGSEAVIEATVVRNTQPQAHDKLWGRGIGIREAVMGAERSNVIVRSSLILDNFDAGVSVNGADAIIEATTIQGTRPRAADQLLGDALIVDGLAGGKASVIASLVATASRGGVASFSATVDVRNTSFDCNAFDLVGENSSPDATFVIDDFGGNACGCGVESVACQVSSPGFEAPEPITPID